MRAVGAPGSITMFQITTVDRRIARALRSSVAGWKEMRIRTWIVATVFGLGFLTGVALMVR